MIGFTLSSIAVAVSVVAIGASSIIAIFRVFGKVVLPPPPALSVSETWKSSVTATAEFAGVISVYL